MNNNEISNKKLNKHKTATNELIRPIDDIIRNLSNIDPIYLKIDNIVETYRDKIYSIYTELEKQSIDFWSNEFILGDLIRYHLENEMYHNVEELFYLSTEVVLRKKLLPPRKKEKIKHIDSLNQINEYIKNYSISNNVYETLIWYYNSIEAPKYKPKEIIYSYINIKQCLKKIGLSDVLTKDQERIIIQIIEQKELECIEYRKKFSQIIEMLKTISNNDVLPNDYKNKQYYKNK